MKPEPEIRYARVGNAQPLYVATVGERNISAGTVKQMIDALAGEVSAAEVRRLCAAARGK